MTLCGAGELTVIEHNLMLSVCRLGWNDCGDEVAVELAKVLPLCQKLTRIE